MAAKLKATKNYNQAQLKQLCQDLITKVTPIYSEQKQPLDFSKKTTVSYYQSLADEINKGCEQQPHKSQGYVITPTWLRDLFTYQQHQETPNALQVIHVKACCYYLGFTEENVYWDSLKIKKLNYLGEYKVYWHGTSCIQPNEPVKHEYNLVLTDENSFFKPINTTLTTTFIGQAPSLHQENVYVELMHPNQSEKFSMIFHIGISESKEDVLSPLLLCVDNTPRPCTLPVLLIRVGATVPEAFIREYFKRYTLPNDGAFRGMTINKIKKMLRQLKSQTMEYERLAGIYGTWLMYRLVPGTMELERIKLHFEYKNQVRCETHLNKYSSGSLELLNSTLKIELRSDIVYAVLMMQVGNIHKLDNIRSPMKTLFLTNGRIEPEMGIAVFVRSDSDYDSLEVPYFIKPNSVEYEQLKQMGILVLLQTK